MTLHQNSVLPAQFIPFWAGRINQTSAGFIAQKPEQPTLCLSLSPRYIFSVPIIIIIMWVNFTTWWNRQSRSGFGPEAHILCAHSPLKRKTAPTIIQESSRSGQSSSERNVPRNNSIAFVGPIRSKRCGRLYMYILNKSNRFTLKQDVYTKTMQKIWSI